MNRSEAARLMGVCAAAFPHYTITTSTIDLYAELLSDIPLAAGLQAVRDIVMATDSFPTVSAIRKSVAQACGITPPLRSQA